MLLVIVDIYYFLDKTNSNQNKFENYLNEAKLKDVIFPRQARQVKSQWGEKY